MIKGREELNLKYFSKHRLSKFNLSRFEERMVEDYFREELNILPDQQIDFQSLEVLLIIDFLRFSNNLS